MDPRAALLPLLVALPLAALPATAGSTSVLDGRRPVASWSATTAPGPGCGDALTSCHVQPLLVTARPGRLVTVELAGNAMLPIEVLAPDGSVVAREGARAWTTTPETERDEGDSDVTFAHLQGRGTVRYAVRVSEQIGTAGLQAPSFRATARLGGSALDRDPECNLVGTPVLSLDRGQVLPLHVRVVTSADLLPEVRRGMPVAVAAYRAIGVALRVSYDLAPLPPDAGAAALRAFARARYGGTRPPGTDAVYVANDSFAGGQADCIGGALHPELGFSVGQVHYSPEGVVPGGTGTVSPGLILAHEVGHTVGGHHEQGNCVESVPAQAGAGTSTESRGPCTVMSPLALTDGRAFGTLEAGAIRALLLRRR